MRRMLLVVVATGLLGVASAGEPQKAAPGGEAGAPAKAAEGKKKAGGGSQEAKTPPAPKGDGGPEKQKPCEPIRPCPIE